MRILTVSAFYEGHGGGIEIVAGSLARALARRGHRSRWAAAAFDRPPDDRSIEAVPLTAFDPVERWTGLPMPIPGGNASRLLGAEVRAADAVIIHDALYMSSVAAARAAKKHGKPWMLVQHIGTIPFSNPLLRAAIASANRLVTRPLLASAPQAVFISDAVRAHFAGTKWQRPPALMFNGVDRDTFQMATEGQRASLRNRLGLTSKRPQLLFVGRFVERKGLSILRAMAVAEPDSDFLLVGSGPIDPASWRLPNVRVLGRKSRTELAEVYQSADALLLPSVGEGYPLVIQEALACGLPVFCGQDSAAADPDASAMLHAVDIDPADPAGTAARLSAAIFRTQLGPRLELADYARKTYDWDANAAWLEQCLQSVSTLRLSDASPTRPFGSIRAPSLQQR